MFSKYIIVTFVTSIAIIIASDIYKIDYSAYEVMFLLPAALLGVIVAYEDLVKTKKDCE